MKCLGLRPTLNAELYLRVADNCAGAHVLSLLLQFAILVQCLSLRTVGLRVALLL